MLRLLVSCALVALPAVASADAKSDADANIQKATAAYTAGDYKGALDALSLAYALDPRPDLLFSIGQLHMKLGNCPQAVSFYKRFLDTHPSAREERIAQKAIDHCGNVTPAEPPPEPPPPTTPPPPPPPQPEAVKPPPPPPPPPPAPEPAHWYGDGIGHALLGAGLVAGGVGLFEYHRATSDRDAADHATSYQSTQDHLNHAHDERTYAIIGASAGGALAVVAVVHYVIHSGSTAETPVAIAPTPHGTTVTWTLHF